MMRLGSFDITDNPLVVRAFRVGLRRGRQSFRPVLWGTILALGCLISFLPNLVNRDLSERELRAWCERLTAMLLMFTGASFVFAGVYRMLSAFAQERTRGTFDFLHLCSLRPSAILWGFLMAGQLPCYLLLAATLPLMVLFAAISGFSIPILLLMVFLCSAYVILISILFLHLDFWLKKPGEFRWLLFVLLGTAFLRVDSVVGVLGLSAQPIHAIGIFLVFPVFQSLWAQGVAVDSQAASPAPAGLLAPFFELPLPLWIHALIFFVPIATISFHALAGTLRHRERKPIGNLSAIALVAWILLYFTALLWRQPVSAPMKIALLSLAAWFVAAFVLDRGLRTSEQAISLFRRCGHRTFTWMRHPQAPPLLLAAEIAAIILAFNLLQLFAASPGDFVPLPLLFAIPILVPAATLCAQSLAFRGAVGRTMNRFLRLAWLWMPIFLYYGVALLNQLYGPLREEPFRAIAMVSPVMQAVAFAGAPPGMDLATEQWAATAFLLFFLFVSAVLARVFITRVARRAGSASALGRGG